MVRGHGHGHLFCSALEERRGLTFGRRELPSKASHHFNWPRDVLFFSIPKKKYLSVDENVTSQDVFELRCLDAICSYKLLASD